MLQRLWDKLAGWKTVAIGAAVALSSAMLEVLNLFNAIDLNLIFTPRTAIYVGIAMGLMQIALRFCTTTPVGVSDAQVATEKNAEIATAVQKAVE